MTISNEVLLSYCKNYYENKDKDPASDRREVDTLASAGSCFQVAPMDLRLQLLARIVTDVATFVATFSTNDARYFRSIRPNCLRVWDDYKRLSDLNGQLGPSIFSPLEESHEKVDLLLGGDGVCVAQVMQHLQQVFKGVESFETDFPVQELKVDRLNVQFKRYVADKENLVEQLSKKCFLRFYQAIYKMELAYREILLTHDSREAQQCHDNNAHLVFPHYQYIPSSALNRLGLQLVRRIPEVLPGGRPTSFRFKAIISSLKEHAVEDKAFLLGFSSAALGGQHAIAISLKAPIHFLDPLFGLGFAETREDLFLFLANFLALKYGHNLNFSLLEFESKPSIAA